MGERGLGDLEEARGRERLEYDVSVLAQLPWSDDRHVRLRLANGLQPARGPCHVSRADRRQPQAWDAAAGERRHHRVADGPEACDANSHDRHDAETRCARGTADAGAAAEGGGGAAGGEASLERASKARGAIAADAGAGRSCRNTSPEPLS